MIAQQVEARKIGVIGILQLLKHFRLDVSLPVSQMMSESQSSLSQVNYYLLQLFFENIELIFS